MEDIDTNTTNGKFIFDVTAGVGELELETMKSRMRAGKEMKRKKVGYTGGKLPYGYELVNKEIRIHEANSKVVKWIFKMRDSNISINKIGVILNENGYVSPRNKKWSNKGVTVIIKNRETYEGGLIRSNENNIRWPAII